MRAHHVASGIAVLAFALVASAAEPAKPDSPPAADPSKAEGRYKNIQVLKGYPADDVVPAMQFISSALGVDCDFCHVDRAPEKDDKKEKQTARKMISMTFAINRDNFEGHREVTCVSCHRGASHPQGVPAVAEGPAPPEAPPEAAPAERPAAASVLDKYVAAVGGADAIAKVAGHVQKGKLTGFGPDAVPVDIKAKAQGRRITTVHGQRGDNITAVDGDKGWLGNSGRPPRDMAASESDAARLDAALLFPSDLKQLFKSFETGPPAKIDGKDAVMVIAKNEGKPPVRLFFDASTGLAVRLVRYQETPLGRNPTQIDYADYRDAGGVKVPYRWTVSRPSGQFTIQLDESRQDVPVDDAAFRKPATPPPPAAPPS